MGGDSPLPALFSLAGELGMPRLLRGPDLSGSSSSASPFPDGEAGQRGTGTCPRAPSTGPKSSFWFPSSGFPPFSLCSRSLLCHLTLPLPLPPHWAAPVSYFLSPSCLQPCLGLPVASPLPSFALPLLPLLSSTGPWSQGRLPTLSLASAFSPGPSQLVLGLLLGWAAPFLPLSSCSQKGLK